MKIYETYKISADGVPAEVTISRKDEEFVDSYDLKQIKLHTATEIALRHLKERIVEDVSLKALELLDTKEAGSVKRKFVDKANELVKSEMAEISDETRKILVGMLTHELIGLGDLEIILADENLEDIVVNSAKEPLWVYHVKYGWLKSNFTFASEEQIANYAAIIARKVGRQISTLAPLLDAHLSGGERANATLFPISTKGNGITIRKFAKNPWTMIRLLKGKLLSVEAAALLWLCLQYELNIIIGGGTASGKTSMLNAVLIFTPPNQRVISIEDTRELLLPEFLQWTPLVTRLPNPEGKGEVTMLDLMINSLRMRPDRIVLGEIRRQREAEVLFEAMHTGHTVYATLHADNAEQVKNRMTTPPINLPESMLTAVHLIIVQYRQRRTGIRRTFEIAEVVPDGMNARVNVIYRWDPKSDELIRVGDFKRLTKELRDYSGMTEDEIWVNIEEKKKILQYMMNNNIEDIENVGKSIALYYRNPDKLAEAMKLGKSGPEETEGEARKERETPAEAPEEEKAGEVEEEEETGEAEEKKKKDKAKKGDEWKAQLDRLSSIMKKDKDKKKK